jgi:UDP-N-acetylglucosamine 2-epimerase (non-hydrolysing)
MAEIAVIYGTRPEFLKLVSLILYFKNKNEKIVIINTGQHSDILSEMEAEFDIKANVYLDIQKRNYENEGLVAQLIIELTHLFRTEHIKKVISQGDTFTVLASAIGSFLLNIRFYHIEAGLRTYNLSKPYPEEFNRRVATLAAYKHFVPSIGAAKNLVNEKISSSNIVYTGNTIINTLNYVLDAKKIKLRYDNRIFITTHRRENLGQPLINITKAIKLLASTHKKLKFIWSLHPNPTIKETISNESPFPKNIIFVPPLSYVEAIRIMAHSKVIISDSGGIQEEVPSLKKKIIILRDETERAEILECGCGFLAGTSTHKIIEIFEHLIKDYIVQIDENPFEKKDTLDIIFNEVMA